MKLVLLALIAFSITCQAAERGARFQNINQMIDDLNLRPYFSESLKAKKHIKVAIFDNGFQGYESEIGQSLPANTQYHIGPVSNDNEETHGFYMARIFWDLVTLNGTDDRYTPKEFHLYNTFGYSNLEFAVNDAIQRGVHLILYSQTWEYGGNFDGHGFINTLINRATDAGIIWINNSGNFGNTTYNAPVKTGTDDWINLPGQNQSVEIRCEHNEKCNLRAVLSWNDFSDDVQVGTDKDLDFILTDDTLNIIASSNLTQQPNPPEGSSGYSKYSREIISAQIDPGLYFLRVKNRSKNFSTDDSLRITVSGDFISMKNFDQSESLLPPADNASVITVGALDSEKTSISKSLNKPDLWTNSLVSFSQDENFKGTSNSAAMVAAASAILMSVKPGLDKEDILSLTSHEGKNSPGKGLPIKLLGFQPTGPKACFVPVPDYGNFPSHVNYALSFGGTVVETNLGWKIMYPFDPLELMPGMQRGSIDDLLAMTPNGPGIYSRNMVYQMPNGFYELVQIPKGYRLCGEAGQNTPGKVFRLPNPSRNN